MNEQRIRVMLVDDHHIVRAGLAALLNRQADLEVAGEAEDGAQAVTLYESTKPDVVLMDARMPGMSGAEATAAIRRKHPDARVVMLTTFDGAEDIHRAFEAGARGYLLKKMRGPEVIRAIREVFAGQRFIPQAVGSRMAERIPCADLTQREMEVLRLLVRGLSNKEIATALNFTEHAAKAHLKNIMGKLGVEDRTKAVVAALQRGIVALE
ncbi:MAG TPA: response regulator transcription factor [Candidatus Binatia bacterium]|nr:response regulator transcription factor [Candidatus Binatia bacterium]